MNFIWVEFIICSLLILLAGKRVAFQGDLIAEKTGIGGLWVGLVLLAIATSLPEIFTGVGSIVFVGNTNLTIGNLIGANSYNLLNIAILDLLTKEGPLLGLISSGHILTVWLSMIPVAITCLGIFVANNFSDIGLANISLFSIIILATYIAATRMIFIAERSRQKANARKIKYPTAELKDAFRNYALNAAIIIIAGIWLAHIGDRIVVLVRLSSTFVGSLLLGFATTLPEIVVSLAALSIGAKDMAVANMFGSNLFNMSVVFVNDLLYRKATIFSTLSPVHIFGCFVVLVMTGVVLCAIISKPKKKMLGPISWYALVLAGLFLVAAFINIKLNHA